MADAPYRLFAARLARREEVGAGLVRLVLVGDEMHLMAFHGLDQRIKFLLPRPGGLRVDQFAGGPAWYADWRAQEPSLRPWIRTYTVAGLAVREGVTELSVDVVDHGSTGPGARFALQAPLGSPVGVIGAVDGTPASDVEYRGCRPGTPQLVCGDASALPAIRNIVGAMPADATGWVSVTGVDEVPLPAPAGVEVSWHRDAPEQVEAVRDWLRPWASPGGLRLLAATGEDDEEVWETSTCRADAPGPCGVADCAAHAPGQRPVAAWVAGESGQVKRLRRLLVDELGVDRAAVAFMGYWREGVAAAG